MMAGDEDHRHLGLSLSLTPTTAPAPAPATPSADPQHVLNLMPASSLPASPPPPRQQQYWNGMCFPYESKVCYEMPFLRGIDVNRAPAPAPVEKEASEDEEAGASSPNSTLSSLSGKRSLPARSDEQEAERGASRGPAAASSDNEDAADTGSRKKLRLTRDQSAILEESFKENNTLNPKKKVALAKQLNLKPRQVEVWFQNRRARTKLKQTEVDCEFLRRCCESLTEENRRLHKEVHELRALKLASPQLYMHVAPPTTLNMCPSCERVSGGDTTAAAEGSRAPLHRPTPVMCMGMAGVGPSGPWGPVPVRPMFVDGPAQRSS